MPEENTGEIKKSLDLIQQAVISLNKKIEVQGKRIEQLEKNSHVQVPQQSFEQPVFSSAPPPPPPLNSSLKEQDFSGMNPDYSPAVHDFGDNEESLEENIGGKWFARIGIVALVLGVSFFLKYAFDNNWIGVTGRIVIGIIIGLILLGIGEKVIRKYSVYGQITSGGGIAVLYLSIFFAFNFYHIIGSFSAFFIMMIITATGIALSLRYDAFSLMTVAIIGGFATPILASSGENNQIGLLSYLVILDLAILAVAVFKKWHLINVIGFFGTALLFISWAEKFYTRQDLGTTMFFLTIFFLIFSISSLVYNLVKKEKSTGVEQVMTLASAVVYFWASYALLNGDYHAAMGFFALILAVYYFLWAYLVRNITSEDEHLYSFLAFLTVGFVTLAIPIQFEQNIITLSWIIEAVILMTIGVKLKKSIIIIFSMIVGGLALLRYFLLDISKYNQDTILIFNKMFFTACIIIGASYLISFIIYKLYDEGGIAGIEKKSLFALFVILANLVTIFSVSMEISKSYGREIEKLRINQYNIDKSSVYNMPQGNSRSSYYSSSQYLGQYKQNQDAIKKLENKGSISLSIFWLIYSIILLAVGIAGKYKGVRLGGLTLLILAILKLFFVDLWSLGTLYRIISSITLGVVLLAISFVYQKYKDVIKKEII